MIKLRSARTSLFLVTEFGNSSGVEANITKRAMPIVIEENVTLSNGYGNLTVIQSDIGGAQPEITST